MNELLTSLEKDKKFDKEVRGEIIKIHRSSEAEPVDILYLTETLAVNALYEQLISAIDNVTKWSWAKKPVIEKFQMTECEMGKMTQRLVAHRYSAYCEIEVIK